MNQTSEQSLDLKNFVVVMMLYQQFQCLYICFGQVPRQLLQAISDCFVRLELADLVKLAFDLLEHALGLF